VEDRLNLRVMSKYAKEHGEKEEQLELLNEKIHDLIDEVSPTLVEEKERKKLEEKERIEKMVDRTCQIKFTTYTYQINYLFFC
jgi:predicted transcriptional regulator